MKTLTTKILLIFLLFPVLLHAQADWKEINRLRKAADTMHFPQPFEFKMIDTCGLSKSVIYQKAYGWMASVLSDMKNGLQIQDSVNGKLLAKGIGAADKITFTMTIDIKDGRYRCLMNQYLYYDGTDSRDISVVTKKDEFMINFDKALIMQKNEAIFKSLRDYIRKNDADF